MTIPDTALSCLPGLAGDLKIRYGGTEIAAVPQFGKQSFSDMDAMSSLVQQMGPALAQIKAVGDIVSVLLQMFDTIKAIPDAIQEGDPEILFDSMNLLAKIMDKVAPHVPFAQHAQTVIDCLKVMKVALGVIKQTLEDVQTVFDAATNAAAEAAATGNTSLQALATQMEGCAQSQQEHASQSLGVVLLPLNIIQKIIENIPAPPNLPGIPDLTGLSLDELIAVVTHLYNALEAITG